MTFRYNQIDCEIGDTFRDEFGCLRKTVKGDFPIKCFRPEPEDLEPGNPDTGYVGRGDAGFPGEWFEAMLEHRKEAGTFWQMMGDQVKWRCGTCQITFTEKDLADYDVYPEAQELVEPWKCLACGAVAVTKVSS